MVRIRPTSYITALPFIASALSARRPADVTPPVPVVVYQFIRLLGPAWNTLPPDVANSQVWLSARNTPALSAVRIGVTDALSSFRHPAACDQTSPILPPRPPDHDPPM